MIASRCLSNSAWVISWLSNRSLSSVSSSLRVLAGAAGALAPDLRVALERLSITLPPLRQRVDDIPMLAQRYLAYARQTTGQAVLGISAAALEILKSYAWPGNLHELRRVMTEAVAACNGPYVEPEHLPALVRNVPPPVNLHPRAGDKVSLRELELQHIRAILGSTNSLQEAADILGLDPQALYRRRKQYRI